MPVPSALANFLLISISFSCFSVLPSTASYNDRYSEDHQLVEEPVAVTAHAICAGCVTEVNKEDPNIQNVAAFAFKSYVDNVDGDSDDVAQSLVRVVKAKTQVVAGFKYILDLEIGWTHCSKSEYKNDPSNCPLDKTKQSFLCNFEILEQKWLNQMTILSSKCNKEANEVDESDFLEEKPAEAVEDNSIENSLSRRKRETGAVMPVRSPTVESSNDNETFSNLAKFAIEQLDSIDEDTKARFPVAVLSGRKQIISVPGWLYHLKIRVGYTECAEEPPKTFEECKDSLVLPYHICNVKILFQPWQTVQSKMTESQCYPEYEKNKKNRSRKLHDFKEERGNEIHKAKRDKKALIGGFALVDPTSESISKLADFVVTSLDAQQNSLHAQKVVRVVEARKQIVNGIKTKLSLELGYTHCRKHSQLDRSTCEIDNDRDGQLCHVTIWEQPWKNRTRITNSKCGKKGIQHENNNLRSKRAALFFLPSTEDFTRNEFESFVTKYEKSYKNQDEFEYRLKVYKENMKKVKLLQDNEQGTATYGATIFADLTEEEFAKQHLGLRPDLRQLRNRKKAKIPLVTRIPEEFDWRHYNAVTPVKNQGFCGSCWAFSVTGNIEGAYAIKHNQLLSFSEQELVDCDTLDEGCNGGLPENAYKSLEKLGGLEPETAYPYDGKNEKCKYDSSQAKAKVTNFVEVSKNETEMAMWLVKRGPMSIGINANAMQFYFGGVSHPWKFLCSPKSLDHGVLIVGYGVHIQAVTHKPIPYWLVKNSWGPHWGEQGYYRVYRGQNTCGIAEMVTSAIVA